TQTLGKPAKHSPPTTHGPPPPHSISTSTSASANPECHFGHGPAPASPEVAPHATALGELQWLLLCGRFIADIVMARTDTVNAGSAG
ncbi:MAG: hypothetical protein ACREXY_22655, partial [Gammaproteobacteria bacterium]